MISCEGYSSRVYELINVLRDCLEDKLALELRLIPELDSRLGSGTSFQRDLCNKRLTATPLSV